MTTKIFTSPAQINQAKKLLEKEIPSYRQAYSDRTAWLMACLSELAYVRFNPLFSENAPKDYFIKYLKNYIDEARINSLHKLIGAVSYDASKEMQILVDQLINLKFEIVETFDQDGTQAILVSNEQFICLAFRGTEATSIKDIKTDAKATLVGCNSGGKIHSGFNGAFEDVELDIHNALNQHSDKPLFITGHSLGGALATIAAKKLQSHTGGVAACYTFGSPRVGNDVWLESIKSPIYRVVNAADGVTMLPLGVGAIRLLMRVCDFISKIQIPLIPSFASWSKAWLSKFEGYLHVGDMRFLTNCPKDNYANVKLLPAVSFWYRVKGFSVGLFVKKFVADHSISIYRKKLMIIAEGRNV